MATTNLKNSFKKSPIPTLANFVTWQQKVCLLMSSVSVWAMVMAKDAVTGARPHQENIISTNVYGCLETARNV